MSITFDAAARCWNLTGSGVSYVIHLAAGRYPLHAHWGAPVRAVSDDLLSRLSPYNDDSFSMNELPLDRLPQECPTFGFGDLRRGMLHVRHADGTTALDLHLTDWRIQPSKPALEGLPSARGDGAETLVLVLTDALSGLRVELSYTLYAAHGIIARSIRIVNGGASAVSLTRALSCCVDFEGSDFRLLTLDGAWARERAISTRPLVPGMQGVSAVRGASGHQSSPFLALLAPDASERSGEVYGMALCYSGSFLAEVDVDQDHNARALLGIQPFDFCWRLAPGESFQTPEAYLCYSAEGLDGMSQRFHRFIQSCITSGPYAHSARPILVNNWEGTYFDFNEEKLLSIARAAKDAGIDLFVMDDGWFGRRDDDYTSLGDWQDDLRKLPHGIAGLSERIHALGMRFGLWVEPEMVSPDSDLYRAHPDWCIHAGARPRLESRHQLVLDLTREDVRDFIVESICAALSRGHVDYVKWDMNRNINLVGSETLLPERMQEFHHRYILGLYEILRRITSRFPEVLFESCASGGGRFDLGMMCYMPQAWTSDNSDAWERCRIQYGTSLVFPPCCMGAHVSAVPNHQTGRITPLETRAAVAMNGTFGYELDLTKLPREELDAIRGFNDRVRSWQDVLLYGDFHRLRSPFEGTDCAWMSVSPDRSRAAVTYVNALAQPNVKPKLLRLAGLDPERDYREEQSGRVYGGDELMAHGLPLALCWGDFASQQFFLTAVEN